MKSYTESSKKGKKEG